MSHITPSHAPEQPQAFSRMDRSFLGAWWWTVDRAMLGCLVGLMVLGVALVASAGPSVAQTIGASSDYHFLKKHIVFALPSLMIMIALSMLSPRGVWRFGSLAFVGSVILMIMVLAVGHQYKGAYRWITVMGFSVQPSEFMKPAFAILAAWLLALQKKTIQKAEHVHASEEQTALIFPGFLISIGLYAVIAALLLAQPDLGMTVVLTAVFAVQIFIAGLRFRYVAVLLAIGAGGLGLAYLSFHHVRSRIDRFLNPESGDTLQVDQSLQAIKSGGIIGVGPGQGTVKTDIPDAHADFIFAVFGEEMGLLFTLALVGVYVFVLLRGFRRLQETHDVFTALAGGGLLSMFGFQAFIHMGSALSLLPAKGMTLPFISYGGSSMLAMAIAMGMVLALTRRKERGSIARSSLTMRGAQG